MNPLPILAQCETFLAVGGERTVISLLGSFAAAGTLIAVARWYVGFLRSKGERHRVVINDLAGSHADLQRNFQEQLDRLSDRHQENQRDFQTYVALMSDIQNTLLRDVIVTIKRVETTNPGLSVADQDMRAAISALASTVLESECHPGNTIDRQTERNRS